MAWELLGSFDRSNFLTHTFDTLKYRYKFEAQDDGSSGTVYVDRETGSNSFAYFSLSRGASRIIDRSTYSEYNPPLDGVLTFRTRYTSGGLVNLYRESLNRSPSISISIEDKLTLYENDTLNLTGTVQDADSGNSVTVKYSINNGTTRTLHTFVSDGSAVSFNKPLTFKRDKLHDGSTAVTGDLQEGVTHTLRVWAEDDHGGKSTVHSRTFNVIPNRPEVKVNGQSRVVETVYCKVNGQAREVVKMWTKVNVELREV